MSKKASINRYNLIIRRLRKSPASLAQIQDHLERQSELDDDNYRLSPRTFARDLADILSLYSIEIVYDKKLRVYRIADDADGAAANIRILEAFDTFQALNIANGLSQHILLEQRRARGTEHFYGLLHAIKNRFAVRFSYYKYWDDEHSERTVLPLAMKEFKGRWYTVAEDRKDGKLKTFGLDRMSDLDIIRLKAAPTADFNGERIFRDCFGITSLTGAAPQEVVLSFTPEQGRYVLSYPLHHSQEVISEDEDELRIRLRIVPTHELEMEILSFGAAVEVIAPETFRRRIAAAVADMAALYP